MTILQIPTKQGLFVTVIETKARSFDNVLSECYQTIKVIKKDFNIENIVSAKLIYNNKTIYL
jgi:hypothetical protein